MVRVNYTDVEVCSVQGMSTGWVCKWCVVVSTVCVVWGGVHGVHVQPCTQCTIV